MCNFPNVNERKLSGMVGKYSVSLMKMLFLNFEVVVKELTEKEVMLYLFCKCIIISELHAFSSCLHSFTEVNSILSLETTLVLKDGHHL